MPHPRQAVLSPTDVLRSFMKEMHAWVLRCAARDARCIAGAMDFDESVKIGTDEYTHIFNNHCSPARSQPREFFYAVPPDYDPDGGAVLSVTEVNPSLVIIETQQTHGLKERHRFTLAFEGNRWVILNRAVVTRNGILDFYL